VKRVVAKIYFKKSASETGCGKKYTFKKSASETGCGKKYTLKKVRVKRVVAKIHFFKYTLKKSASETGCSKIHFFKYTFYTFSHFKRRFYR
jgi:hypothetical protein